MVRHVLLATDGSPSALAAARWLADLGGQAPGLRATVLHVLAEPVWMAAIPDGGIVLPATETLGETMRKEASGLVEETLRVLGPAPVQVQTRTEVGTPAETIVRVANAAQCDLIVVGRRGLNPLAQLLLGSVSARVLQLAQCPVVVIRA